MPHVNDLHEQHDPMLVVSFASGDLATADRDRAAAQSLIDTCADCARLRDDVLAIAQATKALPPAVRTRDFQISPEQAAQLQPGGWRRFFTAPGALFSRQLGVGLTTLGIAGILISSIGSLPLNMAMSAGGAPAASTPAASSAAAAEALRSVDVQQAPELAASAEPTAGGDTSFSGNGTTSVGAAASSKPQDATDGGNPPQPTEDESTRNQASQVAALPAPVDGGQDHAFFSNDAGDASGGPPLLVIASVAVLVAGLLVLIVRRFAGGARAT